jgi:hypothetical protein
VGTARLEVAVVTRSVVALALARPADAGTLEDSQLQAALVADAATPENFFFRERLVRQLAPIFSGVGGGVEPLRAEEVTVTGVVAAAAAAGDGATDGDAPFVLTVAVRVSLAVLGQPSTVSTSISLPLCRASHHLSHRLSYVLCLPHRIPYCVSLAVSPTLCLPPRVTHGTASQAGARRRLHAAPPSPPRRLGDGPRLDGLRSALRHELPAMPSPPPSPPR